MGDSARDGGRSGPIPSGWPCPHCRCVGQTTRMRLLRGGAMRPKLIILKVYPPQWRRKDFIRNNSTFLAVGGICQEAELGYLRWVRTSERVPQ